MRLGVRRGAGRAAMAAIGLACALVPAAAAAADPGRWTQTGRSSIPLEYYQGVTSDPGGDLFFDGVYKGLYRTDSQLREEARNPDVIPAEIAAAPPSGEGYNHIGDISWDAREGGRLLLPLECYYPGAPGGANTCETGSIGVADPRTLEWRYYVKLDPAAIKKVMWAEVSPDGEELWTQQGQDLLVYDMDDIVAANASSPGQPGVVQPVRTYPGAVPPSGITGATFFYDRLYVAGQSDVPDQAADRFQVWSLDINAGDLRLEIERELVGESEGLDVFGSLGGTLHWQIQPFSPPDIPTYDPTKGSLLHFEPAAADITDSDADGFPDSRDACPDETGGGLGGCPPGAPGETDDDNVPDAEDNCPTVANNNQFNSDQDAQGDACDPDEDGDGVANGADNCRGIANPPQTNTDGEGRGDRCDDDDDNDGVADFRDNCRAVANPAQLDADDDGQGDACEPDETAPETTIKRVGVNAEKRRAKVRFASSEPHSTFTCKLSGRKARPCRSPATFRDLLPRRYRVRVTATDAAGNTDQTPAKWRFRVPEKAGDGAG